jgi:hypothetical protein
MRAITPVGSGPDRHRCGAIFLPGVCPKSGIFIRWFRFKIAYVDNTGCNQIIGFRSRRVLQPMGMGGGAFFPPSSPLKSDLSIFDHLYKHDKHPKPNRVCAKFHHGCRCGVIFYLTISWRVGYLVHPIHYKYIPCIIYMFLKGTKENLKYEVDILNARRPRWTTH